MTSIPDVISPVPALLLNRTRGNVGWFLDQVINETGEPAWREAKIVFWNDENRTSGTVGKFNYN